MSLTFFASIELDGLTLYATNAEPGDQHRTVSGASIWFEPRLRIKTISQEFASPAVTTELPTVVSVDVDNTGGRYDLYHGFGAASKIWDNREVTIRTGGTEGGSFESMTVEFRGRIRRGTFKVSESTIAFEVFDHRVIHDRPILTQQIGFLFPNAEEKSRDKYLPVVYGDFNMVGGPASGGMIPAYCIDADSTPRVFRIASHAIAGIDGVYVDGVLTAHTGVNLSLAQFTLATYIQSSSVTVRCRGKSADRAVSGGGVGLLEFATDIIHDLLTVGGASAGDIDLSSFQQAHTDGDQHPNRRWIGDQTTIMELIGEAAFENGFLFFIATEKYTLRFDRPPVNFKTQLDSLKTTAPTAAYDPNDIYTNELLLSFDNIGGEFFGIKTLTNATAIMEYGDTIRNELEFDWLYIAANASLQAERKLLVWSSRAHMVSLNIIDDSVDTNMTLWRLAVGDVVLLNLWQYDDAPMQIHSVVKDCSTGKVTLTGLVVQDAYPLAQWSATPQPANVIYPAKWKGVPGDSITPSGRWF